ncbi:hypothetical protein D3C85_1171980 [compost metagenome]
MGQALEHFKDLLLGRLVEIDQQVATKHEVEWRFTGQQGRVQQIADLQAHLFLHTRVQAIAVAFGYEMAVAKRNVVAPKGILAVQGSPGFIHRQRADVHAVDLELVRLESGIEQRHGD